MIYIRADPPSLIYISKLTQNEENAMNEFLFFESFSCSISVCYLLVLFEKASVQSLLLLIVFSMTLIATISNDFNA